MDWSFILGCLASAAAGASLAFIAVVRECKEIHANKADSQAETTRDGLMQVYQSVCDLDATVQALSETIEETQRIARDGRQILATLAPPQAVRFSGVKDQHD